MAEYEEADSSIFALDYVREDQPYSSDSDRSQDQEISAVLANLVEHSSNLVMNSGNLDLGGNLGGVDDGVSDDREASRDAREAETMKRGQRGERMQKIEKRDNFVKVKVEGDMSKNVPQEESPRNVPQYITEHISQEMSRDLSLRNVPQDPQEVSLRNVPQEDVSCVLDVSGDSGLHTTATTITLDFNNNYNNDNNDNYKNYNNYGSNSNNNNSKNNNNKSNNSAGMELGSPNLSLSINDTSGRRNTNRSLRKSKQPTKCTNPAHPTHPARPTHPAHPTLVVTRKKRRKDASVEMKEVVFRAPPGTGWSVASPSRLHHLHPPFRDYYRHIIAIYHDFLSRIFIC